MDFDLTDEQRALADTLDRFVARDYGFDARRAILASPAGWSRSIWQTLADLGVLGINIPEEHGGLGYGPIETALVMNALGRGLVLEPYLAAAVVAPELIRRAASADFQAEWLPRMAAGEAIVIAADGSRLTLDDGRLSGRLEALAHAACADLLLVARGDALYAVAPAAAGMTLHDYPMLDGSHAADLSFSAVPAVRVGSGNTAAAWDVGIAALCAEAVGILDATLAATGEYLKTRRQFGQPIGRFQALQHRMADMLLHVEQARSMSWLAALRCRTENVGDRQRALSAAKVVIGDACRFVGKNAVQLHGGMGMTDELVVSHWFKRLTAIEMAWGDTDSHLQRFAKLSRAA
jgi:alkylation response protein AidB-like acyl-CoA dehydrogenase